MIKVPRKEDIAEKVLGLKLPAETVTGTVVALGQPTPVSSKFGESYRVPVTVDIGGAKVAVSLFIRRKQLEAGVLHPRSTIFKLLSRYNAESLGDLVGKKVALYVDKQGFYRISI